MRAIIKIGCVVVALLSTTSAKNHKVVVEPVDSFVVSSEVRGRIVKLDKKQELHYTKSEIKAGYKTEFDLKTLQNSKQIELYEMSINQINQELEVMRVLALVLDRR